MVIENTGTGFFFCEPGTVVNDANIFSLDRTGIMLHVFDHFYMRHIHVTIITFLFRFGYLRSLQRL